MEALRRQRRFHAHRAVARPHQRQGPSGSQRAVQHRLGHEQHQDPSLTVRRAETTVELASGQSFAIAGLFQDNVANDVKQFPWLGDLPILGALFRSSSFQRHESELVIIVTPYIVKPASRPMRCTRPTEGVVYASDLEQLLLGRITGKPGRSRHRTRHSRPAAFDRPRRPDHGVSAMRTAPVSLLSRGLAFAGLGGCISEHAPVVTAAGPARPGSTMRPIHANDGSPDLGCTNRANLERCSTTSTIWCAAARSAPPTANARALAVKNYRGRQDEDLSSRRGHPSGRLQFRRRPSQGNP